MHSFSFATTDLSAYGLIVNSVDVNRLRQELSLVQLQDRAYSFSPKNPPRIISLGCTVIGDIRADLDSNLDAIKELLHTNGVQKLELDSITDRYFNAVLESFEGAYRGSSLFEATIVFVCPDPLAYDNEPTVSPHPVDSSPDSFNEVVGGNAVAVPVWKIQPSVAVDGKVTLRNDTRGEEIEWTGVLNGSTDYLEIDSETWVVKKNGTADMSSVAGEFPKLTGGVTNAIETTGFTGGTVTITYSKRYL